MNDRAAPESALGLPMRRREDARLLRGLGTYTDDIEAPANCLHAVFVRSPHAHARMAGLDSAAALAVPGVVAVLDGVAIGRAVTTLRLAPPIPGLQPVETPPMPTDHVRFVGDPVAVVLATTRRAAEDAAELVAVDWDPLPVVTSVADAAKGTTRVDPSLPSNLVAEQRFVTPGLDAAFGRAARIVESRFGQQRQTHAPLEPRGCLARWDAGREHLTLQVGTQAPHPYRTAVAARLGLREWQVTVVAPEMGGGFGQKIVPLREELACAAAARLLGRAVRWRETRGENLAASLHAREESIVTRAAVAADGRLLALHCGIEVDFGAWCFFPADYIARMIALIVPGPYRLHEYGYETKVWLTNKCPSGPMRAPMAIAAWTIEGTMDAIARSLGVDPLELRRRNTLAPEDLPWTTASGQRYEAITPRATLEEAVRAIGYEDVRERQRAGPARLLGIGLCSVVESTTYGSAFYKAAGIPGSGHEAVSVRIEPSGAVMASCGLMGSGQGYETTLAQAVAAGLGCRAADVLVQLGHTDIAPYGMGSRGSRGAAAGGGGLYLAAGRLKAKLLAIAAALLGRNSADGLELVDGAVMHRVAGAFEPAGLTLADIARTAHLDPLRLPTGMAPGLHEVFAYDPPDLTFSNSAHACLVEIDPETGACTLLRYVAAEDAGTLINPMVVAGQTHGAVAMGLSGAAGEHAAYDVAGQMVAASFMDYAISRAADLSAFELHHMDTPNPHTPAGIKGMAEGGTMGAIGAYMNAVNDALARAGAMLESQPATPARIWAALRVARQAGA